MSASECVPKTLEPAPASRRLQAPMLALARLLAAAGMAAAQAQTTPQVTEADLERARRAQPTITEQDIQRAQQGVRMPSAQELQAAPTSAQPAPDLDRLPQPAGQSPLDLEALARGYSAQGEPLAPPQGLSSGPALLVFISLSMPQATLQRLVEQAARAQASVHLRGFADGSLRATVAQVQALIGNRPLAIQIDPQAFERFAIERVPSFVLLREGMQAATCASGSCVPAQSFLRLAGDVSLDYALQHMQRRSPAFAQAAGGFVRRLQARRN